VTYITSGGQPLQAVTAVVETRRNLMPLVASVIILKKRTIQGSRNRPRIEHGTSALYCTLRVG
jgi:hypothetical protein